MRALVGHLRHLAARPLDELCDGLLRRMLIGIPQDDVALVAVRCGDDGAPGGGTRPAHG